MKTYITRKLINWGDGTQETLNWPSKGKMPYGFYLVSGYSLPEFEIVFILVQAKFKISYGRTISIYFDTTWHKPIGVQRQ